MRINLKAVTLFVLVFLLCGLMWTIRPAGAADAPADDITPVINNLMNQRAQLVQIHKNLTEKEQEVERRFWAVSGAVEQLQQVKAARDKAVAAVEQKAVEVKPADVKSVPVKNVTPSPAAGETNPARSETIYPSGETIPEKIEIIPAKKETSIIAALAAATAGEKK